MYNMCICIYGSKPMVPFSDRCTTHLRAYFSGWIGMFTGGTIRLLTHGHICGGPRPISAWERHFPSCIQVEHGQREASCLDPGLEPGASCSAAQQQSWERPVPFAAFRGKRPKGVGALQVISAQLEKTVTCVIRRIIFLLTSGY